MCTVCDHLSGREPAVLSMNGEVYIGGKQLHDHTLQLVIGVDEDGYASITAGYYIDDTNIPVLELKDRIQYCPYCGQKMGRDIPSPKSKGYPWGTEG